GCRGRTGRPPAPAMAWACSCPNSPAPPVMIATRPLKSKTSATRRDLHYPARRHRLARGERHAQTCDAIPKVDFWFQSRPHAIQKMLCFAQEKEIPIEALPRRALRHRTIDAVSRQRKAGQVHHAFPVCSHDLTASARRTLHVVLVELYRQAVIIHQGASRVLHVDLQSAALPAHREDAARHSEERVEIIEFVNLCDEHAAAQV